MRKRMMEKLRKISTMYYLRQIVACLLVYCILLAVPMQVALAAPSGGTFDVGTGIIVDGVQNSTVTVDQVQSVINWNSLDTIGTPLIDRETLTFLQKTGVNNAAVLNRVMSEVGTQFDGELSAVGMRIFIVDPSGITFGPDAYINARQLVASGLNMTNDDFLKFTNGTITKMKFEGGLGGEGSGAKVTNQGTIDATDSVYLVGFQVLNALHNGTITSPVVVLAAGRKVYLSHSGSNVFIEVASDLEMPIPANNIVSNPGAINATGQVLLAAGDIVSRAITGVDSLAAVANRNIRLDRDVEAGEITLTADYDGSGGVAGGNVTAKGTLTSTTGDIEISASDNTIYLWDNINAAGSVLLNNTTEAYGDIIASQDVTLNGTVELKGGELFFDEDLGEDVWAGDQRIEATTGSLYANDWVRKTNEGNLNMFGGYNGPVVEDIGYSVSTEEVRVVDGELTIEGDAYVVMRGAIYSSGNMWLSSNHDQDGYSGWLKHHSSTTGTIQSEFGDVDMSATSRTIFLQGGPDMTDNTYVEADGDILLHDDTTIYGNRKLYAGDDIVLKGGRDINYNAAGALTLEAGDDIILGVDDVANHENTPAVGTAGNVTANGNLTLRALSGSVYAHGTLTTDPDSGGDIEVYSSDGTTYLYGDYVNADGSVLLNNTTEAYGDIIASQDVTLNGTVELKGGEWIVDEVLGDVWDGGDQFITATNGKLTANDWVRKTSEGNLNMFGGYTFTGMSTGASVGTKEVTVNNGELTIEGYSEVRLDGSMYSSGDMKLVANSDAGGAGGTLHHESGTIRSPSNIDISAIDRTIYLQGGSSMPDTYVEAGGDILLRDTTRIQGSRKLYAGDDIVLAGGKYIGVAASFGGLTLEAGHDIILGVDDVANHDTTQTAGTAGDVGTRGNLTLNALSGSVYAHGKLSTVNGGDIEVSSSDGTTYLYGDYVNADGSVLLNNTTEAYGDIIASQDVTLNGTVELKGGEWIVDEVLGDVWDGGDQFITATSGLLTANDWVHKTSTGNLNMSGGYDGPVGAAYNYSVSTKEVRVEGGELTIEGNANVTMRGPIYSSGNMWLSANNDQAGWSGYLEHHGTTTGTIQSEFGDVDMSATYDTIYLLGGVPFDPSDPTTTYVSAGGDILLHDYTRIKGSRKLYAGDDIVLAGGKSITGRGHLSLEAGNDIMFGVDIANHETDPTVGSPGDVTANGNLTLNALGSVYAHGTLSTDPDSGSDIEVYSSNSTTYLYGDYVNADGSILLNNTTESYGDIIAAQNVTLKETVELKGTDDDLTPDVDEGDQRIEAEAGTLTAYDNITKTTAGDLTLAGGSVYAHGTLTTATDSGGDIEVYSSDGTTYLYGDYVNADGSVLLNNTTESYGDIIAAQNVTLRETVELKGTGANTNQRIDAEAGKLITEDGVDVHKVTAGNLNLGGDAGIELGGNVLGYNPDNSDDGITASDTITFEDHVTANGTVSYNQRLDAGAGTLDADGNIHKTTGGRLTLGGDAGMRLAGNVITFNDGFRLTFDDAVTADGVNSQRFAAGDGDWQKSDLKAERYIDKTGPGDLIIDGLSIFLDRDVDVSDGSLVIGSDYDVATGRVTNGITLFGNLTAEQDVKLTAYEYLFKRGSHQTVIATNGKVSVLDIDNPDLAGGYVKKLKGGDLFISGGSDGLAVDIEIPIRVSGNLWITGNGDIQVSGDLSADESTRGASGGVAIISENGRIYTDDSDALNVSVTGYSDHLKQIGVYDLDVDEQTGEPTFYDGPELIDRAAIIIQSNDDLKIGEGAELIALGEYYDPIELFDSEGIVLDDRATIDFLDVPATIGGVPRDEGDPFDLAIYLASTAGNVEIEMGTIGVDILVGNGVSIEVEEPTFYVEPGGTMVLDAYDTVSIGDSGLNINLHIAEGIVYEDLDGWILEGLVEELNDEFDIETGLEDFVGASEAYFAALGYTSAEDAFDDPAFIGHFENFLGDYIIDNTRLVDRLEVVSRITEWLFQAVNFDRLPFVGDPAAIAAFEAFIGGDYILRGAGLDDPAITDGRAWILEDSEDEVPLPPLPPAPLYQEAGQVVEPLTLGLEGCPVLVAAVSVELGVPGDTIEVSLANSFALNTNIQPCESCARFLNAATILRDEDGSGMAAMNQVFNTLAPAGAPFTPEMATSIATAFAGRVNDGTQYATAIEYIDAFVRYLAVLDTEMGSPVADGDSIAFVMGKYGTGITESDNSNIAAFVATRLESGNTFGE